MNSLSLLLRGRGVGRGNDDVKSIYEAQDVLCENAAFCNLAINKNISMGLRVTRIVLVLNLIAPVAQALEVLF